MSNELTQIRAALSGLKARIMDREAKINDPHGDYTGNDSRVPDGRDYDLLYTDTISTLAAIECIRTPTVGRLWWTADTADELARVLGELTSKGATIIKVDTEQDSPRIQYLFELEKARAAEILGYTPASDEWLAD